jgi:hypothetical protein
MTAPSGTSVVCEWVVDFGAEQDRSVRTEIAETMGTFRICDVTLYVPPHMTKE